MSIEEVLAPLRHWSDEGRRAGVATLVRVRRSAPRLPGARFAVSDDGRLAGSVSSGCVEGDLHEHIGQVLAGGDSRLLHYGITDEMAAEVGLACGGEIDVLVAPHDPASPVWDALAAVIERRGAALLVTGLSEGIRGRVLLEEDDGRRLGGLGDAALDEAALDAARPLSTTGGTDVVELGEPPVRLFVEAFLPPPRLAIVGASPVAQALCHLASWLGDEVTVVDPRQAFADPQKFPGATRVVQAWPEEGLAEAGLDRWLDVVVLAHDRKLDVPALETALRAGCRYVGQIGGGRTQRLRREALAERGLDEAALDRIRGPVGLDIGALGPREIAVSILAELVAVRRGRA
jgi:xanthine dehydrogenase accessory factor